jgi:hypothetical protein
MPPPPPPFMGEQVKGEQVKGEQPKSQSAGEQVKGGETRFATGTLAALPLLSLSNFSGDIHVQGADQDYISVRVIKDDELLPLEDAAEVSYSTEGELTIKAQPLTNINRQVRGLRDTWRATKGNFFDGIGSFVEQVSKLGGGWGNVDFEVTVPLRCNLDLGNTSGEIAAEGVEGNISLKTVSGDMSGKNLRGNVSLQSASGELAAVELNGTVYLRSISGEIEADHIDGNLVVQTASGDVKARYIGGKLGFKSISGDLEVKDADLNSFYLSSTSGDLKIEATLHPGEYEIRTVSGDASLEVQRDFSARITGRTVSGDFHCDLPYVHADEDWRSDEAKEQEQTDDEGNSTYQYRTPGYKYEYRWDPQTGKGRGHGHSDERRRRRNRWEFLVGDPATAEQGQTRLRVRTTSGSLTIDSGHSHYQAQGAAVDSSDYTRPLRYSDTGNIARMTDENYEPDDDMGRVAADAAQQVAEQQRRVAEQQRRVGEQQRRAAEHERRAADHERGAANHERVSNKERTREGILQAVERKQISVEEAMRLLRQLD